MNVSKQIESVKLAKADKVYWDDVTTYGSERSALRALDCTSREEAIKMLAVVQPVSIFKINGNVTIL